MTIEDASPPRREGSGTRLGELEREDAERYLPLMDDLQMTESQKHEFLAVIWKILRHFVNMGFDLREVDICGQLMEGFNECANGDVEGVGSEPAISMERRNDREDTP